MLDMRLEEMIMQAPYNLNERQAEWVMDTLKDMTREQKVRQIFCTIAYTDNEEYLKGIAPDPRKNTVPDCRKYGGRHGPVL